MSHHVANECAKTTLFRVRQIRDEKKPSQPKLSWVCFCFCNKQKFQQGYAASAQTPRASDAKSENIDFHRISLENKIDLSC